MVDYKIKSINIDFDYKYPFETDEDYQHCFLSVFGIEEFDEKIITKKTKELYKELKNNEDFVNLLKCLSSKMLSEDVELGLYLLFSFDYIHDFLEIFKNNKDFKTLCNKN